ncbi:MAG: M24 family metallopeptidase [Chloroflexota bacterium]|nr:M24 family metallopeptidase [Chloroflexota bacterium]
MSDTQRAAEVEARIETVRRLLRRRGAGGVMLTMRHNFSWLTRGGVNHVLMATQEGAVPLVVTASEVMALAPTNEADRIADDELDGLPIDVRPTPWYDEGAARRIAEAAAGGALLGDGDLAADLLPQRSRLDAVERERMAELGRLAVAAAEAGLAAVRLGDTESDAVATMTETVARHDARAPVVLAAADARIDRYRHPLPAGAEVRHRLMLVLVVERWGLHAAVTRIRELEPPNAELARRNEAAARVLDAMHAATRPGATLGEVLAAAQSAYRETGFTAEWELHHQGGSIGYQSRERIAVPGDATRIEPGMAFAWNPSITGAKAEETLLLLPDGEPRIVTRPS